MKDSALVRVLNDVYDAPIQYLLVDGNGGALFDDTDESLKGIANYCGVEDEISNEYYTFCRDDPYFESLSDFRRHVIFGILTEKGLAVIRVNYKE